jgi:hypothetical protein
VSKALELNKITNKDMPIDNSNYRSLIYKIKVWLDEAHDLSYREEDRLHPDLHYKLWIFFNDDKTISISLDYLKNATIQNCWQIGWHWRLDNVDKETLSKISELVKQQFIESLSNNYKEKDFKVTAEFNGKYFTSISVSKYLQLENMTENYFIECLLDLSLAWEFVMNNFDFRNIQRKKLILG